MPSFSGWLIVDTVEQEVRYLRRAPSLKRSEGAFPITVKYPDSQRRIFSDRPITLTMPGYVEPEVLIGEPEVIEDADLDIQSS